MTTRERHPLYLNAFELISLKLLAIGLSKNQARSHRKAGFSIKQLDKVAHLLLSVTLKPKLSQLKLKDKRSSKKIAEDIVSPLDLVTNRFKRAGVLGNYVQILMSVCTLQKD